MANKRARFREVDKLIGMSVNKYGSPINLSTNYLVNPFRSPKAGQGVFNKIEIQMRVPIENGSGFYNQVSDFIKLPAAYRDILEYLKG